MKWDFRALAAVAALAVHAPGHSAEPIAAKASSAVSEHPTAPPLAIPADGTLGLVMSTRIVALDETPDLKECPHGFNKNDREQYNAQFPTDQARADYQKRFGFIYGNRGANGAYVFFDPLSATDTFPFNLSQSERAPGFNLDDKVGPLDYTGSDGTPGVDNQMNRVLGCVSAFRTGGFIWQFGNMGVRQHVQSRLVWEISGITDPMNSPHVTVRSYRGLDPINYSADDKPVAWGTQRLDLERGGRYMTETTGKIVDGVLITDPVDMRIPWNALSWGEFKLRGARLHIKLNATGGEGYLGGYADIPSFFTTIAKNWGGPTGINRYSPPSFYRAMLANADGYPGKDGKNTAISVQFAQQFVAIYVRHPAVGQKQMQIASAAQSSDK